MANIRCSKCRKELSRLDITMRHEQYCSGVIERTRCKNCNCVIYKHKVHSKWRHSYVKGIGLHTDNCKCVNPKPVKEGENADSIQ